MRAIANRGEIAVRIASTCRALGVEVVTIHAASDASSPHRLDGIAHIEVASSGTDAPTRTR